MLIRSVEVRNFKSFGDTAETITLGQYGRVWLADIVGLSITRIAAYQARRQMLERCVSICSRVLAI